MSQKKKNDQGEYDEVLNDIKRFALLFGGGLLCAFCIGGLFISSDWINDTYHNTMSELNNNDSDIVNILTEALSYILDFAIWLKDLPVWTKIIGALCGGTIVLITYYDDESK
jgi:hypothetical protein